MVPAFTLREIAVNYCQLLPIHGEVARYQSALGVFPVPRITFLNAVRFLAR